MSLKQVIDFDQAENFLFDATKIAIENSRARLRLVSVAQHDFSESFNSGAGFTYDAAKAEFAGGMVRQKDQRPMDALAASKFDSAALNWALSGSLPGTLFGGASIESGRLRAFGITNAGVYFDNPSFGSANLTVRVRYTPNYSGTPASNINIFELANPANNNDRLLLMHSASGGTLRLTAYGSTGVVKWTAQIMGAAWSPVAGTTYEIELDAEPIAGAIRVFINGVLWGAAPVSSFGRGTSATRLYVGAGMVYALANAEFDDVVVFGTVQHTAGYAPGYSLPDTAFAESKVTLPTYTYTGPGNLTAIGDPTSEETAEVRWIVNGRYWNGEAFVVSDGSYAQSTPKATWIEHLDAFTYVTTTITVEAVFPDGNTQNSVSEMTFTVSGQEYTQGGVPIEVKSGVDADGLISVALTASSVSGSDQLRAIIRANGVQKYHNGSAWVTSDGSLAQSNTFAEVVANASTLNLVLGAVVKLIVLLVSADGQTTPEVETAEIEYNFFSPATDAPLKARIYARFQDILGAISYSSASLVAAPDKPFAVGEYVVSKDEKSVPFNAEGYADIEVIASSPASAKYGFRIDYYLTGSTVKKSVRFKSAVVPSGNSRLTALTVPQA